MNTIETTKKEAEEAKLSIPPEERWRVNQVALRTSFSWDYCYRILVAGTRNNDLVWQEYARVVREDNKRKREIEVLKRSLKAE